MAPAPLEARLLSYKHQDNEAFLVNKFSYSFPEQGMVGLIGPNGVGKSTLLGLLAGILPPGGGEVLIHGKNAANFADETELNDAVTFIFQNMEFESEEKVRELLEFVAANNTVSERPSWQTLVEEFGLANSLDKSIQAVSKGELQKIILCFALLSRPNILLLDEPVFALSREDTFRAMEIVSRYARELGLLVVFSLHELEYMEKFSETVILYGKHGEYKSGPAATLMQPEVLEDFYGVPYNTLKLPRSTSSVLDELEKKFQAKQN